MSEGNGTEIIRIGRKGVKRFALGDGEPFSVDVIVVSNQWSDIDGSFRDEKGDIPRERWTECNKAAWDFVKQLSGTQDITLAEALEFIAKITIEAKKLQSFFDIGSPSEPSSPQSTGTVVYSA
jgi:hypothetical protein